MIIFSTPEFKSEFEKLIKKNSYKYISEEIISNYFNKNIEDCLDGTRLNGDCTTAPFIKKRLGGSGGSRLYLIAVVKKDSIYLSFIHPKTGSIGYENISNKKKTELLKTTVQCIKSNDLYIVSSYLQNKNLIFNKV